MSKSNNKYAHYFRGQLIYQMLGRDTYFACAVESLLVARQLHTQRRGQKNVTALDKTFDTATNHFCKIMKNSTLMSGVSREEIYWCLYYLHLLTQLKLNRQERATLIRFLDGIHPLTRQSILHSFPEKWEKFYQLYEIPYSIIPLCDRESKQAKRPKQVELECSMLFNAVYDNIRSHINPSMLTNKSCYNPSESGVYMCSMPRSHYMPKYEVALSYCSSKELAISHFTALAVWRAVHYLAIGTSNTYDSSILISEISDNPEDYSDVDLDILLEEAVEAHKEIKALRISDKELYRDRIKKMQSDNESEHTENENKPQEE